MAQTPEPQQIIKQVDAQWKALSFIATDTSVHHKAMERMQTVHPQLFSYYREK